jgi:hypothetical protein
MDRLRRAATLPTTASTHMRRQRSLSHTLHSISPLLPFYVIGQAPGQVLWPVLFVPLILAANFVWYLVLAIGTVVLLGQTDRVGQRMLLRYAAWATVAGVIISLGHDVILSWMSQRQDFLLEARPWQLIAGTYLVPCLFIFGYNFLLSWQYLRLRVWQAAIMGIAFALLTAPWTSMVAVNYGQGRLPASGQHLLLAAILALALAVGLAAIGTAIAQRAHSLRRAGAVLVLLTMAVVSALAGSSLWMRAVSTPALGILSVKGVAGDLAFTSRGRLYTVRSGDAKVNPLGRQPGNVSSWSPNGRQLLLNDMQADGKLAVIAKDADTDSAGRVMGAGKSGTPAWAPDSSSFAYASLSDESGQIHIVRADNVNDRIVAEGRSPSWSPDGRRIAYSARVAGRWQIFVMLPNGGDPIQMTSDGGEDPLWSPDGRFIAYSQNNRVLVMDSDGSNKRRLPVDTAYTDTRPATAWAGDGQRLSYAYVYTPESGRSTQLYIWETTMPAVPIIGSLAAPGTPTPGAVKGVSRNGDYQPPFGWSADGNLLGFIRHGDMWTINITTGDEQPLVPADSFAWGGKPTTLIVRPVPTYPPTPTPTPLPASVVESPSVLLFDPRDPMILYAGTPSGVVRKVGTGGWFLSSSGINYPTRVRDIAIDPITSTTIYAGTDGQRAIAGALYRTLDASAHWSVTGLKDLDIYRIVVDSRQPDNLYVGTSKGFYVSSDGGINAAQRNNGLKTTAVTALALDPSGPAGTRSGTPSPANAVLYLGTRQGEIYRTTNSGLEWRVVQAVNSPVTSLLVYRQKTTTIFATTEDVLFSSGDNGDTWNQVSGGIWKVRLDGIVPAAKPDLLYAYGISGVYVSFDGGANWGPASVGLEGTQPSALACHPTDASILYVGTDKGIFKTSNGGVIWTR